jgi:AbrB family looped-hinge helix DNA binding protein
MPPAQFYRRVVDDLPLRRQRPCSRDGALKYDEVAIRVGFNLSDATMDSKGRIVIPEDVRNELGLNEGSMIRVALEKSSVNSGTTVILTKGVGPDEFIKRTKGALKKKSRAKAADPLRLKEIWGGPG